MTVSNREIPHYHLTLTVDLHRSLLWMRERNRELDMSDRLVPAALLLAAAARAARAVPELNGHWVDGGFRPAADVAATHPGVAYNPFDLVTSAGPHRIGEMLTEIVPLFDHPDRDGRGVLRRLPVARYEVGRAGDRATHRALHRAP